MKKLALILSLAMIFGVFTVNAQEKSAVKKPAIEQMAKKPAAKKEVKKKVVKKGVKGSSGTHSMKHEAAKPAAK